MARRKTVPVVLLGAAVVIAAGTLSGIAITIVGAAGPFRLLLPVHIGLMLAGTIPFVSFVAERKATHWVHEEHLLDAPVRVDA